MTICFFLDCFLKLKIKRDTKVELREVSVSVRWDKGEDEEIKVVCHWNRQADHKKGFPRLWWFCEACVVCTLACLVNSTKA